MRIMDPHIHMSSRTTADYEAMHAVGVRAVVEPAFWLGQPRTNIGSFTDSGPVSSASATSARLASTPRRRVIHASQAFLTYCRDTWRKTEWSRWGSWAMTP